MRLELDISELGWLCPAGTGSGGAVTPPSSAILLEDGSYLLAEDGSYITTEL